MNTKSTNLGTIIYPNVEIGEGYFLGHFAVIRENNIIGRNFFLYNFSTIDYNCRIGNNVKIHNNCYICQFATIEDDVFLAPGVVLANDKYPPNINNLKAPILKKGCVIGCNATILPGVTIGEKALIGAGSVVTKDVPMGAKICGNPAKVL